MVLFIIAQACTQENHEHQKRNEHTQGNLTPFSKNQTQADSISNTQELRIAYHFDFPVGIPDSKGYYNAQKFGENNHLGDDWNAISGGNSDLGDTIYSIANGFVTYADDYEGAWGNVIMILHELPNGNKIESLYAHCDQIFIEDNIWIKRGQAIGTIGNVDGLYLAHLHFEIRSDINLPIGGAYSTEQAGYLDPTKFIERHRSTKDQVK